MTNARPCAPVALLGLTVITRHKVAGPSEAFIITGRRGKQATDPATGRVFTDNSGQKVVVGGGVFGLKQAEIKAQTDEAAAQANAAGPLAEAVRIEGEAAAIAARGSAEAGAMQKKADAFARYGDAAVLQMLVEVLPQVVAKASEPLSAVDKLTVISTDGASRLTRTVTDNVTQGMELLSSTTGVDLAQLLQDITQKKATPTAAPGTAGTPVEIGE
ncbi:MULTISPECIES: flotillin domain-containing protein [Streptomyces]|uniref:flotillin domain-containing protein n=1 Tax=Streptomyces TaxID=1883 RepID=UPI001CC25D79|nr:flotillin domain-containing protein [Streptomyces venezuelae]